MQGLRDVKDIVDFLRQAISYVFKEAQCNPLARPPAADVCDEAEVELVDVDDDDESPNPPQQSMPASVAPPDPPPPLPPWPPNLPPHGAQGWKQATVLSEADMANATSVAIGDDEDPDLMDNAPKEALGRSIIETRHDPFEMPKTGGSSVSGAPAQVTEVPVSRGPVALPQT